MTLLSTTMVKEGHYRVREGDDYTKIALLIYGTRRKAVDIARANSEVELKPGSTLKIPNKSGVVVQVPPGDIQVTGLYRYIFKRSINAGDLKEFQRWNGGDVAIKEGELVFFPDLRRADYGY